MKTQELREKDLPALQKELQSLQRAYFGQRMQKATQQLGNTASLKLSRKNIARAKTIITQKQTEASKESVA